MQVPSGWGEVRCFHCHHGKGVLQSMVPRPALSILPGNLLKMHVPSSSPDTEICTVTNPSVDSDTYWPESIDLLLSQ